MPNRITRHVDQGLFVQFPHFSAYGTTSFYLNTNNVSEILDFDIATLNDQLPIIRFDRDHWGFSDDGRKIPAGEVDVTHLTWHEPNEHYQFPYVRVRDLKYYEVGMDNTPRHFIMLDEVLVILGLLTKPMQQALQYASRHRSGPKKDHVIDDGQILWLGQRQHDETAQTALFRKRLSDKQITHSLLDQEKNQHNDE